MDIIYSYINNIIDLMSRFIYSVSVFVIKNINMRENVLKHFIISIKNNTKTAYSKLIKLLKNEAGSSIIYNYYYTDNI